MALTITEVDRKQYGNGNYKEQVVDVTFDGSYPTGGLAFTPAMLGFSEVIKVGGEIVNHAAARFVSFDPANQKLQAWAPGGAEVAALTNLSTLTVRLVVRGRG